MSSNYRIATVGAASLRGKELNEALGESSFAAADFLLMDDQEALGQLESVGDEVTFIQPITPASFERVDFAFFAGTPEVTRMHWQQALRAGASVVDMSYALEDEPGVLVRAPWIRQELRGEELRGEDLQGRDLRGEELRGGAAQNAPDLHTPALVSAHPAAVALALLCVRLQRAGAVHSISATVLEPASEYGRAAMDELHQQTVNLLSFQSLPKEIYDIQIAFNALAVTGEAAKARLGETEARIRRHYALLSAGRLPQLGIQLVHVPVFHGHAFSIAVEYEQPTTYEHVETALAGDHLEVVLGDIDAPSNLSSAGEEDILVRLRGEEERAQNRRFWIWASTDNLKLAALNAVECAQELRKLRPQGTVQ